MAYQNEVTEDAMCEASMSSYMSVSDQLATFMGLPRAAFLAVGCDESGLNLNNADTLFQAKTDQEKENEQKKREDALEAASDSALAIQRKDNERLSNPVKYANGQFNIGGILVDEEDMDATVDKMLEDFPATVAEHNLNAQEAATLFALLMDYQNENDPQKKAKILDDIAEQVSPEVAMDMADRANKLHDNKVKREMNSLETSGQKIAAIDNTEQREQIFIENADSSKAAEIAASASEGISMSANMFGFGDTREGSASTFNAEAQGNTQISENNSLTVDSPNVDVGLKL